MISSNRVHSVKVLEGNAKKLSLPISKNKISFMKTNSDPSKCLADGLRDRNIAMLKKIMVTFGSFQNVINV